MKTARLALVALVLAAACRPSPRAEDGKAARSPEEVRRDGNHLLGEPSPYLEQHAHNPVDWYPWGPEALARAKREKKPIFVSIGYSTCHWCHVMEAESFTNDDVARELNDHFVAIKIDREERPDLDAVYLEAVSALGGSTGWPLNVFLTPALEPYFGGTYFPREAANGRPGLVEVLREMRRLFRAEGAKVATRGREILASIANRAQAAAGDVSELTLNQAMDRLERARDGEHGGFGMGHKFPNAPLLLAELRFARRTGDRAAATHVTKTLTAMANGGVRDQLAGTFHRYATDRAWRVPHFEKTLYDNAQLAALYAEETVASGGEAFATVAPRVLDDLAAGWQASDGGLVVGFDADDPIGEGAFYTWTPAELGAALGLDVAKSAAPILGVSVGGEPGLGGRSVLHFGDARGAAAARPFLGLLRSARDTRPPPPIDDKELAGWNGLALGAFADVGRFLREPRYVAVAQRIARFLTARCWDAASGKMARGFRREARLGDGFLEDYALVALGLIKLHAADGDPRWLLDARAIGDALLRRFHEPSRSTFVRAEHGDVTVPTRTPDVIDGPLPSGGAAATMLFLQLGALAGDASLHEIGARALAAQASLMVASPTQSGFFLVALDHATAGVREAVIAGDEADPRTRALVAELAHVTDARVLPVRVPSAGADAALVARFPTLDGKVAQKGVPTAYVCDRGACQRPTSDPATLRAQLPR